MEEKIRLAVYEDYSNILGIEYIIIFILESVISFAYN